MARILVTNDDGYFSPGIDALAAALGALGEVTIVAPQTEASAVGHALTLRRPLRFVAIKPGVWAVDGTPTDCVNIALSQLYPDGVDLVVSGINKGLNVGDDVTYSGTVAGALEAALLGYPAMAVSLDYPGEGADFRPAAAVAADLAAGLLASPLPVRSFLNVNIPDGRFRGVRATVQARRNHVTKIAKRIDPRGLPYFWVEEAEDDWEHSEVSDHQAVRDGYVSVTPLQPDLTDHDLVGRMEKLTALVKVE